MTSIIPAETNASPAACSSTPIASELLRVRGIWAVVLLLIIQIVLAVYTVAFGAKPAERSWEYQIVAIPDSLFDTKLNELGKDGWEIVSARRASDGSTYAPTFSYELILKRPARLVPAK
jgi:hypothetical protein